MAIALGQPRVKSWKQVNRVQMIDNVKPEDPNKRLIAPVEKSGLISVKTIEIAEGNVESKRRGDIDSTREKDGNKDVPNEISRNGRNTIPSIRGENGRTWKSCHLP